MFKSFIPDKAYIEEFKLTVVCLLIPNIVSFYALVYSLDTSPIRTTASVCWSYIPNCENWYFLQALPYGYSQTIFYAGIFLVFLLIIEGLLKERWSQVWYGLLALFLWKIFVSFVIGTQPGNYDYYDLVLTFVVLFLPFKAWFVRLSFVFLYFLAATIKIHEGWILGTYFTSLETGLAIFGNQFAPLITLVVIVMQIVGAWYLLSRDEAIRLPIFLFFLSFHLYSIVYVGWRYPSSDLFMLCTLFYLYKNPMPIGINKKSIYGYLFLVCLLALQFIPKLIPGDQKFTLEGNNLGLYMFEANHQCISTITYPDPETGEIKVETEFSIRAQSRCNPAFYLQRIQNRCAGSTAADVSWTFDHSINGGPFYRMIDEGQVCSLEYTTFKKNDWIQYDTSQMEIVGYPLKNYY